MPKADVVIWATAVALIMIMLGIIGYLINKGFDSLKASIEKEFKIIWEKIDAHQKQAEANTATLQAYQAADTERQKACDERHKRIDAEMERLRGGNHA